MKKSLSLGILLSSLVGSVSAAPGFEYPGDGFWRAGEHSYELPTLRFIESRDRLHRFLVLGVTAKSVRYSPTGNFNLRDETNLGAFECVFETLNNDAVIKINGGLDMIPGEIQNFNFKLGDLLDGSSNEVGRSQDLKSIYHMCAHITRTEGFQIPVPLPTYERN